MRFNPVEIWMYKSDTVIARNNVAECRQSFLDSLYLDFVWQRIANVL